MWFTSLFLRLPHIWQHRSCPCIGLVVSIFLLILRSLLYIYFSMVVFKVYYGHGFCYWFHFVAFLNGMVRKFGFAFCLHKIFSMFFKFYVGISVCPPYVNYYSLWMSVFELLFSHICWNFFYIFHLVNKSQLVVINIEFQLLVIRICTKTAQNNEMKKNTSVNKQN